MNHTENGMYGVKYLSPKMLKSFPIHNGLWREICKAYFNLHIQHLINIMKLTQAIHIYKSMFQMKNGLNSINNLYIGSD